jgi:hypothetical protein
LKVADIRRHIDEHTTKPRSASRSLYPFFFSPKEEVAIQMRLCGEPCAVREPRAAMNPSALMAPSRHRALTARNRPFAEVRAG